MKRKIIQMAGKTMVVSLPSDVVKKYNLKKGQELDVSEEGGKVSILIEKPIYKHPCEIKADECLVEKQLEMLYTQGYDEIKVYYDNNNVPKKVIRSVNKKLAGFEVLETNGKYCIIKSISIEDETKLQSLIRRLFLILLSLFESYEAESIENLIKLANVCKRVLHQKSRNLAEALALHNLITAIQEISDLKCKNTNLAKSLIEQVYNLYYKFDDLGLIKLKDKIEKELATPKIDRDTTLLLYNTNKILEVILLMNIQLKQPVITTSSPFKI